MSQSTNERRAVYSLLLSVFVLSALVLSLASCISSSRRLPSVRSLQEAGLVTEQERENLREARRNALVGCTDCHRVYWPAEFERKEWSSIVRDMGKRSGLSVEERKALTQYYKLSNDLISQEMVDAKTPK